MKKILVLSLSLIIILSSCGKKAEESIPTEENDTAQNSETTETESNTEPEVQETTEAPTEAPTEPEPTDPAPVAPVFNENGHTPAPVMYHLIMEEPFNNYTALLVRPGDFSEELDLLNEAGYTYLFADEFAKTENLSVVLTFDDGYEDNYTTMFPILKEHGAKATIFLVTDLLDTDGYLTTAQVKEMAASGYVHFGSHTVSHCDLAKQSDEVVDNQFSESKRIIESITGMPCDSMAYPAGSNSASVREIASKYFKFAYTTKSPNSVKEYTDMNIPRHYGARTVVGKAFMNLIAE